MTRKTMILLGIGLLFSSFFLACATAPSATPFTNALGQNASGTATGFARGYGGEVNVTLTLLDGFITNVVVRADQDTPMFANPVISRASNEMVANNTTEVDIVSGATITSRAVNEAAQAALDQILAGQ